MKSLKIYTILAIIAITGTFLLTSCNSNSVSAPVIPPSHPITSDTLSGIIKGTLLANKTYYLKDSIIVNGGDTLLFQSGVKLQVIPSTGSIYIRGVLISQGTQSAPNYIQPIPSRQGGSGKWTGIICDSTTFVGLYWTHVENTGAADWSGHSVRSLQVTANAANTSRTEIMDCVFDGTADDGFEQSGGVISILRNTFKQVGQPDGDAINLKNGVQGEVAYNVVWSDGGNCVKMNSGKTSRPTDVCIHNNTFVASGLRRITELGYGILIDKSSRAQVYNNILGDNYQQLEITSGSDTAKVSYGYNLFFGTADTVKLLTNIYPADGWGKLQSNDVVDRSSSPAKGYSSSLIFVSYAPNFTGITDNNDYHLLASSPAKGKGLQAMPTNWTWSNPIVLFSGDADLGAFTSSSNSHK